MPKKRKSTPANEIAGTTLTKVATWLSDRIGEMEGEEGSIAEEEGRDFMPALRGLRDRLRTGEPLK